MKPTWRRRSLVRSVSPSAPISVESIQTSPAVGRSRPARRCIKVDLPEPDGPITAVNWPSMIASETPRRGSTAVSPSPKRRLSSRAATRTAGPEGPFAEERVVASSISSPFACWRGRRTSYEAVSASSSAQRLIPLVVGADSRHTIVQPSVGSRSDPSRRPIGVQVDAIQWPAGYGGFVRLRSLLGRHGLDALIIVLAAAAEVEVWLSDEQTPRIVTAPAALLWTLPLLFRRRFPLGAPVVVFAVLAAEAFLPGHAVTNSPVDGIALFAAFGLVATSADLRSAVGGAVIGYVALLLMVLVERPRFSDTWPVLIVAAATWVVGRALAERARRTATLAERANRLEREHEAAVTAERARIARELHDVIAHSVSVMTV